MDASALHGHRSTPCARLTVSPLGPHTGSSDFLTSESLRRARHQPGRVGVCRERQQRGARRADAGSGWGTPHGRTAAAQDRGVLAAAEVLHPSCTMLIATQFLHDPRISTDEGERRACAQHAVALEGHSLPAPCEREVRASQLICTPDQGHGSPSSGKPSKAARRKKNRGTAVQAHTSHTQASGWHTLLRIESHNRTPTNIAHDWRA